MEGTPITPSEALEAWDRFEEDPRTFWIPEQGRAHELSFRRSVHGRESTPNLWTDAWIAALAESADIGLTSYDSGFSAFGLKHFELLKG
jgi:predicted nucleic acid-binding protein